MRPTRLPRLAAGAVLASASICLAAVPAQAADTVSVNDMHLYAYAFGNDGNQDVNVNLSQLVGNGDETVRRLDVSTFGDSCTDDGQRTTCTFEVRDLTAYPTRSQVRMREDLQGATASVPDATYTWYRSWETYDDSLGEYVDSGESSGTDTTAVEVAFVPTGEVEHFASHVALCGDGESTCQDIEVQRSVAAGATLTAFGHTWGPATFSGPDSIASLIAGHRVDAGKLTPAGQ